MKLVRNVVIGIAVLFFATVIVGLFMPSTFAVERSRTIAAPPEVVFGLFATPRTWADWSAWNTRADSTLRYAYEGPETGVGATMKWTAKQMGSGTLRITEAAPHASVRYEVRITDTPVVVRGAVSLAPDGAGTRVTWHDEGEVGKNPMMRLVLPVIRGSMGNAFELGFDGLERLAAGAPSAAARADSAR